MDKYERLIHRFLDHENRFWIVYDSALPRKGATAMIAFADKEAEPKCPHIMEDGTACGCPRTPVFEHPAIETDNDGVAAVLGENEKAIIWDLLEETEMVISKNQRKSD